MATAKKTPSGMWKVRVYSHTTPDGKKHYRAFTAPTKQEAEQEAARFSGSADRAARSDLTVAEAIDGYIRTKEGVLSPATVRGYRSMERVYFDQIATRKITRLKSADVQMWISSIAGSVSAKTVSNVYGLFTAALAFYQPDITFRGIKLPQKARRRVTAPSDEQVTALYRAASPNLKKAIALEAFASMRRSEACALLYGDITDGVAHVHQVIVKGTHGWVTKGIPKTSESDRYVRIPDQVLKLIGSGDPEERVVPVTPDTITELFCRLRDSLGLSIRYHDLRHYYASIAAVLQIPSTYVESFGGWRPGSKVMRETYQNTIRPVADQYAQKLVDHFDQVIL